MRKEFEKLPSIAAELENSDGELYWCDKQNQYRNNRVFQDSQTGWMNGAWYSWQAKAQVPEWISVNDQMPPIDETVLVCWDHAQDIEPEKEYVTTDENLDEYWPNCQDEPPTHWMPLPKVIEAQEQNQ